MRRVRALGVGVAALLLLNVVALITVDGDAHVPAKPRVDMSPAAVALRATIAEISHFVAGSRGLGFTRPVDVTLLKDADFDARLIGKPPAEDTPGLAIARTLGFIAPGKTAADAAASGVKDVVGFYDVKHDKLFVRGDQPSPYVRTVLAHELTHALQDQRFDMERRGAGVDDERDVALDALAEGDAMRVEHAYYVSMSVDDQRAVDAFIQKATGGQTAVDEQKRWPGERAEEDLTVFPYRYGAALVVDLIKSGGQASLDAAFRDPPISSEQVIDLNKLKAREAPREVAKPVADGALIDQGVLGELFLRAILEAQWGGSQYGYPLGWGGGRYVAWNAGGETCVRINLIMDTPEQTSWVQRTLDIAAELHGHAGITGPGFGAIGATFKPRDVPLTYTVCGPPRTQSWDAANKLLQARGQREMSAFMARYGGGLPSVPAGFVYNPYTPPPSSATVYSPPPTTPPQSPPPNKCINGGVIIVC